MMAFYSQTDEAGRKTFHPTKDLDEMLRQDRITDLDLRQFRSSNKVELLPESVLKNRGFERNWSAKEWVRETAPKAKLKKSLIGHWADTFIKAPSPPKILPPTISVAERVHQAVHAFMMEHAREPNKLWISTDEWNQLSSKLGGFAHYDTIKHERSYQGMQVQLLAHGSELFVGLASGAAKTFYQPADAEGLHPWQQVVFMPGNQAGKTKATLTLPASLNLKVGESLSDGVNKVGTVREVVINEEGQQVVTVEFNPDPFLDKGPYKNWEMEIDAMVKEKAQILAAAYADSHAVPIKQRKPKGNNTNKGQPKPRKKIIPPSQLKRKLAL